MSTAKTGGGFGGYVASAGSVFGAGSGGGGAFGSGGAFAAGTFGGNENKPPTTSSTFGLSSGMGATTPPTGPRSAYPITPPTGPKSLHGSPFVSTAAPGGHTFRTANSVQYRPSPLGTSQMVAQNIDKGYYSTPRGPVVYGTGFQGTPYR
ncbi:hypothetical protein LTR56_026480 [Elasticomyces elasticus]|nr:hypothetical protein LTR56_026480 [Elasticomyces elasticus]KAK3642593.1 hypothetical protein LTR22_016031 [Elasticomyces elasticus]KAK4901898.1 hypothetical protein LTR49_027183 [Elasticomyces elasticus]KAK5747636.1 hypothetical protein LTS12_022292 [Elasticomyces elasticus]